MASVVVTNLFLSKSYPVRLATFQLGVKEKSNVVFSIARRMDETPVFVTPYEKSSASDHGIEKSA